MTEEQYKKCIEIGYSFKSECRYFPFLNKDDFIKITISLAKVLKKKLKKFLKILVKRTLSVQIHILIVVQQFWE